MKHTEFWDVVGRVFPAEQAQSLVQDLVLVEFNATAQEALNAGVPPLLVWKAIIRLMDLPEKYEYLHRVNPADEKLFRN